MGSTISLRESLPRPAVWLTTTRGPPSPPARSRPLSGSSSLVSSPSTPSLRAPRLSPSTPAPSKQFSTSSVQQSVFLKTTNKNSRDIFTLHMYYIVFLPLDLNHQIETAKLAQRQSLSRKQNL